MLFFLLQEISNKTQLWCIWEFMGERTSNGTICYTHFNEYLSICIVRMATKWFPLLSVGRQLVNQRKIINGGIHFQKPNAPLLGNM